MIRENKIGYLIPRRWEDAAHEYQTDPIARAIIGHFASQERARDSYWLWNNRGRAVEVTWSILGMIDHEIQYV